jgi:hypothetical protein
MIYKNYHITYNPKPIPTKNHDWDFVHDEYNGPGDNRHGSVASVDDAMKEIDLIEDND